MNDDLATDDHHLLEVIAQQHGHGPRRPLVLLDIVWAETGSEAAARAALQRLLSAGLIELRGDGVGRLSDRGALLVQYK